MLKTFILKKQPKIIINLRIVKRTNVVEINFMNHPKFNFEAQI